MRLVSAAVNDMRYQVKYGFYFLYAFITVLYITILIFLPAQFKAIGASLILLTDPAMLGFFFIGGIWLLEKDEGVHMFYGISPLRPAEYIFSKAVSLAMLSTLSAFFIVLIGVGNSVVFPLLLASIFIGACIFTLLGLTVATFSKSVNHYMILGIPIGVVLILPPILTAFGISHLIFDLFPGTMLWRLLDASIYAQADMVERFLFLELTIWLGLSILVAVLRVPAVLQSDGGEIKHEKNL